MAEERTKIVKISDVMGGDKSKPRTLKYYFIIISGENTGKIYPFEKAKITVGRGEKCDIQLMESSVSREHASIEFSDNSIPLLKDNQSTNGTFVNGLKVDEVFLNEGDKVQFGLSTVFKVTQQDSMEYDFQSNLYESSIRDPLTGVYNKRYFTERIKRDFTIALRNFRNLAIVFIDLDFFKKVNDTYGHLAGDAVLVEFAKRVDKALRKTDVFCRYGGEEFAIIVKDCSNDILPVIGERIRLLFDKRPIQFNNTLINITVSQGIASIEGENIASVEDLIADADKKLYKAKAEGRNRVIL